ncbi:uncharacterized protein LOC143118254 [Alosa pseudoharengus]|uniref:uncharacterized protein LOC143118254 n=1 Tax=Alosa pseudoharengus TaxID=34774 RepID=UPI003F896D17
MRSLCILIFCLSSGALGSTNLNAYLDGAVIIKCKYESQYKSSKKYFYKGRPSDYGKHVKWEVEGKLSGNGKFTLCDTKKGFFMVLVTQLTKEDEGDYQCVVDKATKPLFSGITLRILSAGPCCGPPVAKHFTIGDQASITCNFDETSKHRNKYLCKLENTLTCFKLTSVLDPQKRRRYNVIRHQDNLLQISVTILYFDTSDTGDYWCGTSDLHDRFFVLTNKVRLMWHELPSSTPSSSPSTSTSTSTTTTTTTVTTKTPTTARITQSTFTPASTSSAILTASSASPSSSCSPSLSPYGASIPVSLSLTTIAVTLGAVLLFIYFCHKRKRQTQGHFSTSITEVDYAESVYEEINHPRISGSTDAGARTVYATTQLPTIPSDDPTYSTADAPTISSDDPSASTDQIPTIPTDDSAYSTVNSPTISSDDPNADSPNTPAEDHTYEMVELSTRPSDDLTDNPVTEEDSTCASIPVSLSLTTIAVTLGAVLLFIYFCHKRKRQTQGHFSTSITEVDYAESVYEEINHPRISGSTDAGARTVYATTQLPTIPSDDPTYSTADAPTISSDDPSASTDQIPTIPTDDSAYSTVDSPTISSDDPNADSPNTPAEDHTYEMVELSTRPSDDLTDNPVTEEDSTYLLLELSTSSSKHPSHPLTELPTNPHGDPCRPKDSDP